MIKEIIENEIYKVLGTGTKPFVVEKSEKFGEYATNVGLVNAKELKKNPRETAEYFVSALSQSEAIQKNIRQMEVAGPGFINFYVKDEVIREHIGEILSQGESYGANKNLAGEKVVIEYTDPNPFKEFHIGHLMTNTLGESLSRIVAANGADVKRACYQGDVGMHVAKTIYGLTDLGIKRITDSSELGKAYARGAQAYDEHKAEIQEINKKIYDRSDDEINRIYDEGRKISLEYFETIYQKLGTHFDEYFFESETGPIGKAIVEENLGKVFEKGEGGAIVFKGEEHGLHTRVFLNSEGLPTYEAKELGLAKVKYERIPYDRSIIVTANEVNDYFQVLLCAMSLIFPELEKKTKHISHGMLRLPTGKMSSRTGDVITAEALLGQLKDLVLEKIEDRELENKEAIAEKIALAAIKYSILKQSPGKDIVFDFEKSISFEGDSGAYLQYAYVRTQSILKKAEVAPSWEKGSEEISDLEKLLFEGLPNAILLSYRDLSPNYIATYLVALCREFNSYYEQHQILGNEHTPYRLALVSVVGQVLKNGLFLLSIPVTEKM